MKEKVRIKLRAYDHKILDQSVQEIVSTVKATGADCLFAWAESTYPEYFAPAGTATQNQTPYTLRHYTGSQAYLATSATDNHLYYLGPISNNAIADLGSATSWLVTAGCQ